MMMEGDDEEDEDETPVQPPIRTDMMRVCITKLYMLKK